MPVYNGAPYIAEAIKSILSQDFSDFELIIADNNSTDNTINIIEMFAATDTRIKFYRHSKNFGPKYNFEFVKNKATGKYFMWAAHDDTWSKVHLTLSLDAIVSDDDIKFVFPSFRLASIHLPITKLINNNHFTFIESENRTERVLGFTNLHHSCHKCNLVYSLFDLEFINDVYGKQDITNDGLLSVHILSAARGKLLEKYTFSKRYKYYWPGFLSKLIWKLLPLSRKNNLKKDFDELKKNGEKEMKTHFPEFYVEIEHIFERYQLNDYLENYKITQLNR